MKPLNSGMLLVAEPFLKDPNFLRSVILICEHNQDGSFGFVLNKKVSYTLGDLVSDLKGCNLPVYCGGPVQLDTVHFIHTVPNLIEGGCNIGNGIYWGGSFETVKKLVASNKLNAKNIKFFVGYSGWDSNQLQEELDEQTWLTLPANNTLAFNIGAKNIWSESLKQMGATFVPLANYPIDPTLN
jgi:putative transcriptional regulator